MIGLPVQITDINNTSGDICRQVVHALNRAINFKRFLDRFDAPTLVSTFGFTLADANTLKSAFTDLQTICTTAGQNRAFIDQLSGLGDV